MIQVTVRIVQRSTRNSNSQMLVNEKNSMESNARLCTKTLAVAAAFIPGVSENISMVSPKKKAHNISSFREVPELNFRIK